MGAAAALDPGKRIADFYAPGKNITINNQGFRGLADYSQPKPAGSYRAVFLGDSFTLGYYFEDTVAARLERRLNQIGDGVRYEVVNCAATSYSPLVEYMRIRHQLAELRPDEIILNIDLTDVYDDYWRYRPLTRFAPDGEPLAIRSPQGRRRRIVNWFTRYTFTGRFLFGLNASVSAGLHSNVTVDRPPIPANLFAYNSTLPVDSDEWKRDVAFCLQNIARIIRFTRERGVALTITTFPHRQQLEPDTNGKVWHREFERRVEALCRELGVDYFSAFEGIAQAFHAGQHVYWGELDMHFTPDGQRLWGGLIADYYVARHARLPRGSMSVQIPSPKK